MGFFFFFLFVTLVGPIICAGFVAYVVMLLRSLNAGERPNASRVSGAVMAALLFELESLGVLLITIIILAPRNSGYFMYGGVPALLVLIGIMGICGFVYFLIRGAPWWCQWKWWWQLIFQPGTEKS